MQTNSKQYKVIDFLNWSESNQLVTNPHYQRNLVWPDKAKSYLIDFLLKL